MDKSNGGTDKSRRSYRRKYRRLPNGFGQISKIKGNLRNPYRAMVTVGKSPTGKPIVKMLKPKAYFKTYNEAYQALMEYHTDPFDLEQNMTMEELYDIWSEQHYRSVGKMSKNYRTAWKYCSDLYRKEVREIRAKHIKYVMLHGTLTMKDGTVHQITRTAQSNIKLLLNMMLDYAVEHDIVQRNYAREMKMPKEVTEANRKEYKGHRSIPEHVLTQLPPCDTRDMILVQCFMGWRPGELCNLRTSDIDLENMTITGGSKTKAGKNRIVPVHPAIQDIIREHYDPEHEHLFGISYEQYRRKFKSVLPEHQLHDCRKTFVTMAKKYKVDEYAIKRMVGHTISDLTESVYTDRSVEWLREEICRINVGM